MIKDPRVFTGLPPVLYASCSRFAWLCSHLIYVIWRPGANTKNHMVFGRIYLSRYTPSFSRSLMVYASTVQAQANRPCPGDPLFTP
jgi:hypothetical protein